MAGASAVRQKKTKIKKNSAIIAPRRGRGPILLCHPFGKKDCLGALC
jgi:hypothetical protein